MIAERVRKAIGPGAIIPKPEGKGEFVVKGWGRRRGEAALIYRIPNHKCPSKPYEKGITESEFERAYAELQRSGQFTRAWFNEHLPNCSREGGCNYTTIGGVFELLGEAIYSNRGAYERCRRG